jgi:hypothetical protein
MTFIIRFPFPWQTTCIRRAVTTAMLFGHCAKAVTIR